MKQVKVPLPRQEKVRQRVSSFRIPFVDGMLDKKCAIS